MQWKNTVRAAVITGIVSVGALSVAQAQPGGFWLAGALLGEEDDQVVVLDVQKDSYADEVGLEVDDVITEVEGEDVDSIDDVVDILHDLDSDEDIDLSIEREGDDQTYTLDKVLEVNWNAPTDTGSAAPGQPNQGHFPPLHNGNPPEGFTPGDGNPPPRGFGQGGNPSQGIPQDGTAPDNGTLPQGNFQPGNGNQGNFQPGSGTPPLSEPSADGI